MRTIDIRRRRFLRSAIAGSSLFLAAGIGLRSRAQAAVSTWPQAPFAAKTGGEVLRKLYGDLRVQTDKIIHIDAPFQAENGTVVPVTVEVSGPDVESISILMEKNATPLAAHVNLLPGSRGFFKARFKMAQSSDLKVYAKAGGKLYTASQHIKVTVGGCGG